MYIAPSFMCSPVWLAFLPLNLFCCDGCVFLILFLICNVSVCYYCFFDVMMYSAHIICVLD